MSNLSRRTALFSRLLALCLAMALVAGLLSSQARPTARAETGGFAGQVRDVLTRAPIASAVVSAGDALATTGPDGQYRLDVPPGTYEVYVHAAGYLGMSLSQQTAQGDGTSQANFAMIPASPSAEQRAQLDALFAEESTPPVTSEELEALRATDLDSTSTPRLPATVRVLMADGIVVVMPMDEYVRGVLPREMAPHWPLEALKAQAVIARCYAANARRHAEVGADLCTTVHCQVWSPVHYETTDRAVYETHNVAVTHSGRIISAFYFAHCDGHTHNSEDVWETALPYCRSVACPCGYTSFLGHGVGLCQQGARTLAESGRGYTDILMHYYTGVQVVALPPHTLSQGRVTPAEGDTAALFTYEVVYTGPDPAIAAYLYVDGYSYSMAPVSSSGSGLLYRYTTQLPVGSHTYAFRFEDGYSPAVTLPESGTLPGPTVRLRDSTLPTPTPLPTPSGTQGWQWTQTARTDWADGSGSNVVLTTEGDGEVALEPAQSQGVYTSTVKEAPLEFVASGSSWQAQTPAGTALTVEVRAGTAGGDWSDWQAIPPMDAEREDSPLFHGELLYLRGTRLQYRVTFHSRQAGVSPVLYSLTLISIDSRLGPTAAESLAGSTTPAGGGPTIISRSAWGANPNWMTWTPEYRTVRKFVIHHTATSNGDLDPAATVRAIYYYHAVTRGWGDIGYNYLIDTQGRIYEGRFGGEGVVGGHAKQYAWGSIGISLIGNYDEVDVPAAMQNALVELIAWKGTLHLVDPTGHGFFIDKDLPNVMAHRDGSETTCPGRYAYARLPNIRQLALSRMAQIAPNVHIDSPAEDATVGGVVDVSARGSPAVTQVEFWVDGVQRATDTAAPFTWKWNTVPAAAGQHLLQARARTASGLSAEHSITVYVDKTAPRGSLRGPTFSNTQDVYLTTSADDASWMEFSNGWRWEGEGLRHQVGSQVADPTAWNGQAWLGSMSADPAGWWYGPYLQDLPTGHSYRVYFRLKVANTSATAALATIDVTDDLGRNTYASQILAGADFAGNLVYQEPYVDFDYYRRDTYGLEFRTSYTARTDLYLDRVYLFRAPRAYATGVSWSLSAGDGPKEVAVRYRDAAGNVSEVYTTTVILDTAAPQWLGYNGSAGQVRDSLSGLRPSSSQFSTSADGGQNWGPWQMATATGSEGTTASVSVSAPGASGSHLRYRIADRAGNLSESAAIPLAGPVPTQTATVLPTATRTSTRSPTPTGTATSSPTPTGTPNPTLNPTATEMATETPTELPTATPTATLVPGRIRGRTLLQGRTDYSGVLVSIPNAPTVRSAADGSYVLPGLSSGAYTVTLRLPGYLEAVRQGVEVAAGGETVLPDVTLRGGDINGDCEVDVFDLVAVAANFGTSPREPRADINGDGRVDLRDLVLVSVNLRRKCPSEWPQ